MADKYPNQHSFIKEIVQENGVNLAEITTNPEVAEEKATTIGLKTICELSRIKKAQNTMENGLTISLLGIPIALNVAWHLVF
ncbi:hypothetical protein NHP190012_10700 [Helicobacter sp. NHP19-012]|uniref:Uncharacterized protein n=1 Tax=Helicobacter gastrofelis TaxID=2849642 RepID=A0ABM7SF31_9HELI|nr:hypothetical protein [Helicobacter sp. NHP19-012]BCZ19428.1 hypothetical protein NHP190012_10700 [Helicobacter sp. NHP19-012]